MSIAFDLYLITDRHKTCGRDLVAVVEAALAGGVRAVHLREKDLPLRALLALAERLRAVTAAHGAQLLINDRIDVALAVGADGVHLPADHLPIPEVRRILGPQGLIGVSAHTVREVEAAADADFIVLGPVFDTPSKRPYGAPLGLAGFGAAVRPTARPVFAIGGLRAERVDGVLRAGAAGVAVIGVLLEAQDPAAAASGLLGALSTARAAVSVARL